MDTDIFNKSEEDIIDILLKANTTKLVYVLAVLRGFSSTLKNITGIADNIPLVNIPHKVLTLSEKLLDDIIKAHASVVNGEPDKLIKNGKIIDLLKNYYKYMREGDRISRTNEKKEVAMNYYKEMWSSAKKLTKNYRNAFEKREWIGDLFMADALSYMGSINSAAQKFKESKDNFDSSLIEMDRIKKEHGIYSLDRGIEIASYNLSNDLRDISNINKFIERGEIKAYDNTFDEYVGIAEKEHIEKGYNRFTYVREARNEVIEYLDKCANKTNGEDYREISMNLNVFLRDNNARKINRSVGKYHTVRCCYDFIFLRESKENIEAAFKDAVSKMHKGLLLLTRSYMGDDRISSIDEYINSEKHFPELQNNYARNFTILYGVSSYIERKDLMDDCMRVLSKSLQKEEEVNNEESKKTFYNSINEAIVKVLKPFEIKIKDTNEFIEDIRNNIIV